MAVLRKLATVPAGESLVDPPHSITEDANKTNRVVYLSENFTNIVHFTFTKGRPT